MAEKKTEQKPFDPITRAISDTYTTDFFGYKHWSPERFIGLCRMRGLTGAEIWNHATLSPTLKLIVQETRDLEEAKLDALLHSFASTIGFDESALRRHFYAIKFQVEEQFLAAVQLAEEKRKKLERLAEEAETGEIPSEEGKIEESEEE